MSHGFERMKKDIMTDSNQTSQPAQAGNVPKEVSDRFMQELDKHFVTTYTLRISDVEALIEAAQITPSLPNTPTPQAVLDSRAAEHAVSQRIPVNERFLFYRDDEGDYIFEGTRSHEHIAAHGATVEEAYRELLGILELRGQMPAPQAPQLDREANKNPPAEPHLDYQDQPLMQGYMGIRLPNAPVPSSLPEQTGAVVAPPEPMRTKPHFASVGTPVSSSPVTHADPVPSPLPESVRKPDYTSQSAHEPLEWGTNCLQAPDLGPHECAGHNATCLKDGKHVCCRCGAFCLCGWCNEGNPRCQSSVSNKFVHTDTPVGRVMCLDQPSALSQSAPEPMEHPKSAHEWLYDALGRYQVTHIHSSIREALKVMDITENQPVEQEEQPEITNEIEIRWRKGFVCAGPFIRENVRWTPDQADQFADYLHSAAQSAREQITSAPAPSEPVEQGESPHLCATCHTIHATGFPCWQHQGTEAPGTHADPVPSPLPESVRKPDYTSQSAPEPVKQGEQREDREKAIQKVRDYYPHLKESGDDFIMSMTPGMVEFAECAIRAERERDEVKNAANEFIAILDFVTPAIDGAFQMRAIHGMPYKGPNYENELKTLRILVAHPANGGQNNGRSTD